MKRVCSRVMLAIGLLVGLVALTTGCGSLGITTGASLELDGVSMGNVTMQGKPVSGIPSGTVNLLLDVSAHSVVVTSNADGITLTAQPSNATVQIGSNGITIKGLKPENIKVQWPASATTSK